MTDQEQLGSTIVITDGAGVIKGSGFLIDDAHAMTCAHVIDFCRKSAPVAPFHVLGQKNDASFRLTPLDNAADLSDPDVAILALDAGERFPEGCNPVAWEPCRSDLQFRGPGLFQVTDPAGGTRIQLSAIEGTIGFPASRTRYFVSAPDDDARIEPGTSGGAIFSRSGERGLIGMVAEYQQDRSGQVIHAEALRDCWPTLRRAGTPVAAPAGASPFIDLDAPVAPGGIALEALDERISYCDRSAQTFPFRAWFAPFEKARRGVVLATIHGRDVDLPDRLCERLLMLGPGSLVRAKGSLRQIPRRIVRMEDCAAPDEAGMRMRVEFQLQDALASARPGIAAFVTAIRKLGRPLTIEVRAGEDFVARHGAMAARVWRAIAADLAAKDLGAPLFVFFVITRAGDDEAALEGWCANDDGVLMLDALGPIPPGDIEAWSEQWYADRSDAIMAIVRGRAGTGDIRLKQLQDWLSGH